MASSYLPGRKRQYGAARWHRYEHLRVRGFTKTEARELSRVPDGKDPVLRQMIRTRRSLVSRFEQAAKRNQWKGSVKEWRFHKGLREWYKSRGFATKGAPVIRKGQKVDTPKGLPSIFAWFRHAESRAAARAGVSVADFRKKRKTPPRRKVSAKQMQDRAKTRSKAYTNQRDKWIEELREAARKDPGQAAKYEAQIKRLEKQ